MVLFPVDCPAEVLPFLPSKTAKFSRLWGGGGTPPVPLKFRPYLYPPVMASVDVSYDVKEDRVMGVSGDGASWKIICDHTL